MKLDFLIIGAEKCGTTWLADMLRQHPGIFIPPEKELFYFNERFFESPELHNYNFDQPLSWYLNFFKQAGEEQIKGEASVAYIWDEAAPERIFEFDPGLKLVACLRSPVERAFSQYLYYIQRGYFPASLAFEDAIEHRPDMLSRGLYARQLDRYYARFSKDQLYLAFFDDLQADNRQFLHQVETFLNVPAFIPDNLDERSNVTGIPRFPIINRMIAWVRYPLRKYNPPLLMKLVRAAGLARLQERIRLANTRAAQNKPELSSETRQSLQAYFREDIKALEALSGRDLGAWYGE